MKEIKISLLVLVVSIILVGMLNGNVAIRYREKIEPNSDIVEFSSTKLKDLNINGTRNSNWSIYVVDTQDEGWFSSSLALDSTDHPHISYHWDDHSSEGYLNYASSLNGSWWDIQTVDSNGDVGDDSSIALDKYDCPHISYYDSTNRDLKYAHENSNGSHWQIECVDAECQGYISIALDENNQPHITYEGKHEQIWGLKYTYFDGLIWKMEGFPDTYIGDTSIVLDKNNRPHIGYNDYSYNNIISTYYDGVQWQTEMVASDVNENPEESDVSIILDGNDYSHICYSTSKGWNWNLSYAHFNGIQWQIETVDSYCENSLSPSIALDRSDRPHISYFDNHRHSLKHAYYDGNEWHIEIVDSGVVYGESSSLVMDSNDRAHIVYSYTDIQDNTLIKYAVMDALPPLLTDNSSNYGTTGDNFLFNVTTKGKAGVASVKVNWSQGNLANNQSLNDGDDTWSLSIHLDHCIDPLEYNFIVNDTLGNTFLYPIQSVSVTDNDIPTLDGVNSLDIGTTGDSFQFNISTSDNIDVETVFINWTHGSFGCNTSLTETNNYWTKTIQLNNDLADLNYIIYIRDTSNNIYISSLQSITVIDNDAPILESTLTQDLPTTGDPFTIRINAMDNIDLELIQINYTFNENVYHEVSMDYDIDGSWSNTVVVPPNAVYMEYCFHMKDASNNWYNTSIFQKNVFDNDKPEANAGADITVNQFDNVNLNGSQSYDNVGILTYCWKFIYSNAEQIFFGKQFHFTFDVAGIYNITLNITDEGGNWDTDFVLVEVKDLKPPIANAGEPQTKNQGVSLTLNGSASFDENGICNYTWTFKYQNENYSLYGEMVTFKFDYPGLYNITLTVKDKVGNTDSDLTIVTINDAEIPVANATTGNLVFKVGSTVVFDGTCSSDNVGIVNYTWTFNDNGLQVLYGELPSYIFNNTGDYIITLTVMDEAGNIGRTTCSITIEKEMTNPSFTTGDDALFTILGFGIEWQDVLGAVGSILSFSVGFLLLTRKRRRYKRYEKKLVEIEDFNEMEQFFKSEVLPLIEKEKITPHHSVLIKSAYDDKRAEFKISMKHDDDLKIYKGALKKALQDGEITADEESMLAELRETVGITMNEHNNLLREFYGKLQEGVNVEAVWDTEEEEIWGQDGIIISQNETCVFCNVILDIAGKEMKCPKCGAKYDMKGKLLDDEGDMWGENMDEFEEDDIWD